MKFEGSLGRGGVFGGSSREQHGKKEERRGEARRDVKKTIEGNSKRRRITSEQSIAEKEHGREMHSSEERIGKAVDEVQEGGAARSKRREASVDNLR